MFWRSRNYEKELELLANKIRKARGSAQKAKLNNRRYRSLFILYAIGIYCIYLVVALSTKSLQKTETKVYLVVSPVCIYLMYRLLSLWLGWRESTTANHLRAVENTREGLVQEYKEKVNYSQIQKVLATGAEDSTETASSSKQKTSQKQKKKGQSDAPKTPVKKQQQKPQTQRQDSVQTLKDQIKRENGVWLQPQTRPQAPQTPKQQLLQPPMPMSPMAPPSHSWMDRIADLVLGENEMSPNSRYALICPVCHAHNGLARYGENPEDVVYRCPVCGTLNGKSSKDEKTHEAEHKHEPMDEKPARSQSSKSPEMEEVSQ